MCLVFICSFLIMTEIKMNQKLEEILDKKLNPLTLKISDLKST